jgi:hypothetical protein
MSVLLTSYLMAREITFRPIRNQGARQVILRERQICLYRLRYSGGKNANAV